MQRYFLTDDQWINEDQIILKDEDAHHIVNVMRMNIDDNIICNFPNELVYVCKIVEIEGSTVMVEKQSHIEEDKELPVHVTIAQGLPKGAKLELIVQKGTELGASQFIFVQTDRSVTKWDNKTTKKKLPRYEKIVKEASEQCHRTSIPILTGTLSLEETLQKHSDYEHILFAYEEEAKTEQFSSFYHAIKSIKPSDRVLICIGPEGGFSEREVQLLKNTGAKSIRLGKRILRTETAPLYALSSISFYFEEYMTK